MLAVKQYAHYYQLFQDFLNAGAKYFAQSFNGTELYKYRNAYISLHAEKINEEKWHLDVWMSLVERNARENDSYHVCGAMFDGDEDESDIEVAFEEIMEVVNKTIDDPPERFTRPLPDKYCRGVYEDHIYDEDEDEDEEEYGTMKTTKRMSINRKCEF